MASANETIRSWHRGAQVVKGSKTSTEKGKGKDRGPKQRDETSRRRAIDLRSVSFYRF